MSLAVSHFWHTSGPRPGATRVPDMTVAVGTTIADRPPAQIRTRSTAMAGPLRHGEHYALPETVP
jgi:hypothetical protein